ncbi:MAG: acyltransferase [Pseudomonadota bacterium]
MGKSPTGAVNAGDRKRSGPQGGLARIRGFDGLRGVAAFVVVIHHYLCLLHPELIPGMSDETVGWIDGPYHILWNGRFAVMVFFVLSGFVIAASAERHRRNLIGSVIARYGRLSIPVAASCLLAWFWLALIPYGTEGLSAIVDPPSRWWRYSHQETVPPIWSALWDGFVGVIVKAGSDFNNVLWTIRIELVGSFGLFALYAAAPVRRRGVALTLCAAAVMLFTAHIYSTFVLGAALYEAAKRGALSRAPAAWGVVALVVGVLVGGAGSGAHERLSLPETATAWQIGNEKGLWAALAAAALVYAVFSLQALQRMLESPVAQWLGRVSFALYLVHVPLLYTVVASAVVAGDMPRAVLAASYFAGALLLAHLFTILVDEPVIRRMSALRSTLSKGFVGRAPDALAHLARRPLLALQALPKTWKRK